MNTEQTLLVAERQRSQARVYTRRGDLDRAEQILERLIELLRPSLASADESVPAPVTSKAVLARALADAYGMLGGVEWRRGRLRDALRAYGEGRALEQNEEFDLADSYNLVNFMVVSILLDPTSIAVTRSDLDAAISKVRAQVEGERRDQWWAWADYALLNVLANDTVTALYAYDQFFGCGPTASDYRTVRRVLQNLHESFQLAGTNLADPIEAALNHLERRSRS